MEHDPASRPTDDDLIAAAVRDWELNDYEGVIDDRTARIIASQEHGGQTSALYSLASAGAIDMERLSSELMASFMEAFGKDDARAAALDALGFYCIEHGDRGPVEGWHHSTRW